MTPDEQREYKREQQWQATLRRAAVLDVRPEAEPGSVPRPGEIYLCERTADFPVEWLVVEADDDGVAVVVIDDYPLVGSQDIELPAEDLGGVAVARAGVEARTRRALFEPELRTNVLDAPALERVRDRRAALAEGTIEPTLFESMADGDLDYQRWIEGTLLPAREALEKSASEEPPGKLLAWRRRLADGARAWGPAVAAAAALVVAVGLGIQLREVSHALGRAEERVAELERQGMGQASELAAQQTRLERETRLREQTQERMGTLERLLATAEEASETLRERLSTTQRQLRQMADMGTVTNLPKLFFGKNNRIGTGSQRGTPLVLPPGNEPRLLLEVEVVDPEPYPLYRVRLEPTQGGEARTFDALTREAASLRLTLSRETLVPGEYDVRIDGLGLSDEPELLDEWYRLRIEP